MTDSNNDISTKKCSHSDLSKEYIKGMATGDYICNACGVAGYGKDWVKIDRLRSEQDVFIHNINLISHPFIKNVNIDTKKKKKNIIITGKNGIGKSTFLKQLKKALDKASNINTHDDFEFWRKTYFSKMKEYDATKDELVKKALVKQIESALDTINFHASFCDLVFNNENATKRLKGDVALKAFFNAKRTTKIDKIGQIESAEIKPVSIDQSLSSSFIKHLANSRSQLAFAESDGDLDDVAMLKQWFNHLDEIFSEIFEDNILLKFDRKKFEYKISTSDGKSVDFNNLSEGYAAIINIVTEIIMRMEAIEHGNFTLPGIVMIDEVETHLHVSLQKKILRLLTKFFPNIQFIITTHSPFVLTSLDNALVYDMGSNTQINSKEDLWQYSYEDIVEGYFDTETHSEELDIKIKRFEDLSNKSLDNLSNSENKERILLRTELEDVPTFKLADIELRLQALGIKK